MPSAPFPHFLGMAGAGGHTASRVNHRDASIRTFLGTAATRAGPPCRARAGFLALESTAPAMQRLIAQLNRVAGTDVTMLAVGESGSGKEVVARAVHERSSRAGGPFVAVNCGAIAPTLIESELFGHEKGGFTGALEQKAGYFEQAQGGTLFLDEVTEMPVEMQIKPLRVLESRNFHRVGGDALLVERRPHPGRHQPRPHGGRARRPVARGPAVSAFGSLPAHIPRCASAPKTSRPLARHFLGRIQRHGADREGVFG